MRSAARYGVLGSILGAIFGDNVFGGVLSSSAPRCDTLSFSREQEYQADYSGLYVT